MSVYALALLVNLLAPNDKSAAEECLRRGNDLLEADQVDEAIEQYQRAQALYPSPRLQYNFGLAHEKGGRIRQAVEAFERFVEGVPPEDAAADRALAQKIDKARARIADLRAQSGPEVKAPGDLRRPVLTAAQSLNNPAPVKLDATGAKPAGAPAETTGRLKWWIAGVGVVALGAATAWYLATRPARGPAPCMQTFCPP